MKILIVDDEQIMRNGLRYTIPWENYDFQVLDAVSNGKKALEVCKSNVPDIIITDIRMPVMDGLELTKIAAEKYPTVVIIILSAYDDFKYAQEAIRCGADEYILKSELDCDNLLAVLLKMKEKILRRKSECFKMQQVNGYIEQLRENLMIKLLTAICYEVEIQRKLEELSVLLQPENLILIQIYSERFEEKEKIKGFMEKYLGQYLWLDSSRKHWIILANMTIERETFERLAEETRNLIQGSFFFSESFHGFGEVREQNMKMQKFMEVYNFYERRQIVCCSEGEVWYGTLNHSSLFTDFMQQMEAGHMQQVRKMTEDLFDSFSKSFYLPEAVYEAVSVVVSLTKEKLKTLDTQNGESFLEENEEYGDIRKYKTLGSLRQAASRRLESLYCCIEEKLYFRDEIISKAVEFMQDHITEEVTLQNTAKETFCSPSYLSYLFKKKTGKNFSEYLSELRIKKAKRLLQSTQYTVSEIAEMVGIVNSSYFTKVFTKHEGMSPNKYRKELSEK